MLLTLIELDYLPIFLVSVQNVSLLEAVKRFMVELFIFLKDLRIQFCRQ